MPQKYTLGTLPFGDLEAAVQVATDLHEAGEYTVDEAQMIAMSLEYEQRDEFFDRLKELKIRAEEIESKGPPVVSA